MRLLFFLTLITSVLGTQAQRAGYWQQRADYTMSVSLDVKTHQLSGQQTIAYTNHSPDTLQRLFYHLYFNAFQVGSGMDHRNRYLPDPDERVGSRIRNLKPGEEGRLEATTLTVNGKPARYEHNGTILEVWLEEPILPGATAQLQMDFSGQVPIQIRRSGRDNAEGIAYSMSQWYPKLCAYDQDGWHPNPYIGREFYGVWGDWDVKLTLDKTYIVAATGYLQNPEQVGFGYEKPGTTVNQPAGNTLTWHFKAPNVHDFVWAADPDYTHTRVTYADTLDLHFFFQKKDNQNGAWDKLPQYTLRMFEILNKQYGAYPYRAYSFIQGGDGGMEYPMATLITGNRPLNSLIGVAQHELIHSWYQMVLATDEAQYAWMDEGFNTYVGGTVGHFVMTGEPAPDPFFTEDALGNYRAYQYLVASGKEEPLTTHADHFETNSAYGLASYIKGAVYLGQLSYVVGQQNLQQGMLRYFNTWKFKHPTSHDFLKVMEDVSGLVLDWYHEYFVNTTKTVDYAVAVSEGTEGNTLISLQRAGLMPMPLDVVVTYTDGTQELHYIPLDLMRGEKPAEPTGIATRTIHPDWDWTRTEYTLTLSRPMHQVKKIELDPTQRMADIQRDNNVWDGK